VKRFLGIVGLFFLIVLGNWSVLLAGQADSGGISGNIFGRKNGMIHPFLGISATHTDNLTNSTAEEKSDIIYVISPGLKLAFPGSGSTGVKINTSTSAPGGMAMSRGMMNTLRRFQGIVVYNPKIKKYDDHSEEDFTEHTLTGGLHYNVPGGLTLDVVNNYKRSQEMWGETGGEIEDQADYSDNVSHAIINLDVFSRFNISASGGYHFVTYKDEASEFRDRHDISFSGILNFQLSPKLKLSCEYKKIDVEYDELISSDKDSTEDSLLAGISWIITGKSQGKCKFGYMTKDFVSSTEKAPSTWTGEISLAHNFTNRTAMMIGASRSFYETNIPTAKYYITNRLNLAYNQLDEIPGFSDKIDLPLSLLETFV